MNRASKNVTSLALVLFFASAVLCATLAAPGQSLASVSGCAQDSRAMEMAGCEHRSSLCGFDRSSLLFSGDALSSAHASDTLKNTLRITFGQPSFDSSAYGGPFVPNEDTTLADGTNKVSVYLYNSVLNL